MITLLAHGLALVLAHFKIADVIQSRPDIDSDYFQWLGIDQSEQGQDYCDNFKLHFRLGI